MAMVSRDFQIFAKPAGALCNFDCRYCYYLEKQLLYPEVRSPRMPDDLLEQYILQHIEASPNPVIAFSWHGGEPTVLGLDFFRKIVTLQRKHLPPGRRAMNGIQTNGILLDEDWCRFLASERFGVGLSLDGPAECHDRYRLTRGGEPSHKQVMLAYERLQRHRIPCDLLCVVHDWNAMHPTQVYRFFREIGAEYLGFLPVVEEDEGAEGHVSPHTVPAETFGTFLCTVFDEWMRRDTGRIMVQIFDEASRPARGLEHSLCIFRETCGDIPVVEHNGDFYSCDHYVNAEHRLGNIREMPLAELLNHPAQIAFGNAKRDGLPRYCRLCEIKAMCNGGCPKDRFLRTPEGEAGLNYLCPAFKRFFTYSRPWLSRLAIRWDGRLPPEPLTPPDAHPTHRATAGTRRNDPCPCGSGLKYKRCCLGR